jgi:hypothetical protein
MPSYPTGGVTPWPRGRAKKYGGGQAKADKQIDFNLARPRAWRLPRQFVRAVVKHWPQVHSRVFLAKVKRYIAIKITILIIRFLFIV